MTKSFHYLFAILLTLATSTALRAQDAPSAPLRSPTAQPTETPSVQSTPSPTPEEKAEAAAEATPASTAKPAATAVKPAEERDVSESAKPREEKPEPEAPSPRGGIASRLKALETKWETSKINHDVTVIKELVADDYVGTSSSGKVGNKSTLMSEARKDKNIYDSAVARSMSVRTYGPRVAVVVGVAKETGKTKDGKKFSHSYRFTDTWMQRNGRWQCIASHAVAIPKR